MVRPLPRTVPLLKPEGQFLVEDVGAREGNEGSQSEEGDGLIISKNEFAMTEDENNLSSNDDSLGKSNMEDSTIPTKMSKPTLLSVSGKNDSVNNMLESSSDSSPSEKEKIDFGSSDDSDDIFKDLGNEVD